jgi:hypothetical protein
MNQRAMIILLKSSDPVQGAIADVQQHELQRY